MDSISLTSRLQEIREEVRQGRVPPFDPGFFLRFLLEHRGLAPATADNIARHLRRMAGLPCRESGKPGTRVDCHVLLDGEVKEVIASFCVYRDARIAAGASAMAVGNDYRAMKLHLRLLGIPFDVLPACPTRQPKEKGDLPSPEQVFDLHHHRYGPFKSYEAALVQHLLFFDFAIGARFPSELHALRLDALDPDKHILTIEEPKKSGTRRKLVLEQRFCCTKNVINLMNYLAHWRAKVDPNMEREEFFLRPDGQPFPSKEAMASFLRERVKPHFPWFHGYLGRTWCINARLIESGIERENGHWQYDWVGVANWVGHENLTTLRKYYDQYVDVQRHIHGTRWMLRAFINPGRLRPAPFDSSPKDRLLALVRERQEAARSAQARRLVPLASQAP